MSYDHLLDECIQAIVQTQDIEEQSHLQVSLKNQGYDIPQATLSRRLKKLNIVKVAGIYKTIEHNQFSKPIVLGVQVSEMGLIVLQTQPGNASSLAYYFDQKYVSFKQDESNIGIIGTIAGDDTVLLILKRKKDVQHIVGLLRHEFPYLSFSAE